MKKLLVIQQDDAYFLFETLQVLEKHKSHLKDFELTLLVDEKALRAVYNNSSPVLMNIYTSADKITADSYDISVNFSLKESSWNLHGLIHSAKKLGPYIKDGATKVDDLWSTYLMTLKSKAPFLTFHLQDVYRNILGFKSFSVPKNTRPHVKQIVFGTTATHLFSAEEQEALIHELALSYPGFPLKDISEVDLIDDVSNSLYIGPATLDSLKLCEAGARGIFLFSSFQGFNLLPYSGDHVILSTRGQMYKADVLLKFVEKEIQGNKQSELPYAQYRINHESLQSAYLESSNVSDDNYPFYQSHVVLWNYLLNLQDCDLEITRCSAPQIDLLKQNREVLAKFIRLHDYAMVSIDTIYQQSKEKISDTASIEGHLKNLVEIDTISDNISSSHSLLRPVLDFYRIRRGQNHGNSLHHQAQESLLTYSEEHQALKALDELFSVTLRKNEVNI